MKRHYLFFLMTALLFIGTSRVMGQQQSAFAPANLNGIWQMCFYVSGTPNQPGELKPSNSFKILSDDGKFTNMTMIPNHGAIIIGSGTYKQTAANAYTEHVEKNLHLPQLVGVDNVLEFEMKGGDVMVLKFFVNKDKEGNAIDSWYYETWKRVKMPHEYPKDLVR
ncbi:DUF4488 domain-containing protein [Phocaeicola sp.]